MCEILAPAGDEAAFFAALRAGADAIYLGLKDFSARKAAANFSPEQLKNCADAAHALGAKVYVALNTLVKEGELSAFFAGVLSAWNAGADALIVQDIFLGSLLKETYPEMVLHLSTQAGVCNIYGARLAKRMGFSRVILARETPMEDIEKIAAEIETEVFVQGALCTCFSGQCYMSSFAGGNSGNRGLCKQPCRKKYRIDRAGHEGFSYALSLSDLCAAQDVPALVRAGVCSFKIEGRMRSAAYVGAAVKYYKDVLKGEKESTLSGDVSALKRAFNRGNYTRGYAFGQDKNLLSPYVQGHMGERVGTVCAAGKNDKYAFVRSDYIPCDGDGFKVIRAEKKEVGGGAWRASYPQKSGGFFLARGEDFREGDGVYLTLSAKQNEAAGEGEERRAELTVGAHIAVGEPPRVRVSGRFGALEFTADFAAEAAKSAPFTEEDFAACFQKTDRFPFRIRFGEIAINGSCFVLRSALNAFRREVYSAVFAALAGERKPLCERAPRLPEAAIKRKPQPRNGGETVLIGGDPAAAARRGMKINYAVFCPHDYKNEEEYRQFFRDSEYYAWHKYLYLPAYCVGKDLEIIEKHLGGFDGVYAEGTFALEWLRGRDIKVFAGTGFNLFNGVSARLAQEAGAYRAVLSKELSLAEMAKIENADLFVFAGGSVKVMELGHCPFGKDCARCDKRFCYTLTDEQGRAFPLVRYENSVCRFEIYNSAALAGCPQNCANRVYDFRTLSEEDAAAFAEGKEESVANRTAGALRRGIL